jgi:hypothetical protein
MIHLNLHDIIRPRTIHMTILLFISCFSQSHGQKAGVDFDNQLSSWANLNFDDPLKYQFGGRYLLTIDPYYEFSKDHKLDAELSVNTHASFYFYDRQYDTLNSSFKPYRLWLRYSTARLELRIGLQKINFGSAVILRPLMWFDKMDFRDPLQLTDGVYAFLGRYYFKNNTNIWLWTLYGNSSTKGWEIVPSVKKKPEPGGRIQIPLPRGEAAISYHHRTADFSALYAGNPMITETKYRENLFALDGKWDLGAGIWFEMVLKLNDKDNILTNRWESFYNAGMDYTFSLGNGLNLTTEYFRYSNNSGNEETAINNNYSVLAISYPLNLINNLTLMVYYNWNSKEWYRFVNCQLKYDYFSFHFMTFWNPDTFALYSGTNSRNMFTGKGIQVMAVLNF